VEELITIPKVKLTNLENELEQTRLLALKLERQLQMLTKMLYGKSSERRHIADPNQLSLFDIPETKPEEQVEQVSYTRKKAVKKQPKRMELPANLPRVEQVIEPENLPADAVRIGEEVTEVLEMTPPELYVRAIIRPKYASKRNMENQDAPTIVVADMPTLPLPRSLYGATVLAHILISKYVDHLPFYRQRQMFVRLGYNMAESTMGDALNRTCQLLQPLFETLRLKILTQLYLQADESTIKVQDGHKKGSTHLGYYWVYHAPLIKGVIFDYLPSRAKEGPALFLRNFSGNLQTDGYQGYNGIAARKDVTMFACMAHVRRKFIEAEKDNAKLAGQAVDLIRRLYEVERHCKEAEMSHDQRLASRQEHAKPILVEFKAWLDAHKGTTLPQSPLNKAIFYTLNLWSRIERYLEVGMVEIDNNLIENTIRPLAVGRKNYMFAGSHKGAENAAMMYSFFGSCKLNNVNPQKWLEKVLTVINDTKTSELEQLLPENLKLTEEPEG